MRASVAVVSVLWAGACGDGAATAPPPTEASSSTSTSGEPDAPGDLHALVERSRLFAPERMLEVVFMNSGESVRQLSAYRLDSPFYEPIALHERAVALRTGGGRISMPMPYGSPRCTAAAPDDGGTAIVAVVDGGEVRLPIDATPLRQQHAADCAVVQVEAAADLRFGDEWAPGEPGTVVGTISLRQRTDGTSVSVQEMAGTVIFSLIFDDEVSGTLRVDDEDEEVTMPVVVSAAGCSAHALTESKKTYKFPTWVSVDGAEPVRIELEPEGAAYDALEGLLSFCEP